MTPAGKVYGWSKIQKLSSNKIRFPLNFENPQHFFYKTRRLLLCNVYKEKMLTIEIKDWKLCIFVFGTYTWCCIVFCNINVNPIKIGGVGVFLHHHPLVCLHNYFFKCTLWYHGRCIRFDKLCKSCERNNNNLNFCKENIKINLIKNPRNIMNSCLRNQ